MPIVDSKGRTHVIVIGAGVIGLQVALTLLEAGHDVTLVAKHHPGDRSIEYTSPWAGAQWRTHAGPDDTRQQRWDMETYNHWTKLVEREESQNVPAEKRSSVCPIQITNIYTHSTHPDLPPPNLWYSGRLSGFASTTSPATDVLPETTIPTDLPGGIAAAWTARAYTLSAPRYIQYLYDAVLAAGGIFAPRVSLPPLRETGSLAMTLSQAFAIASETRTDGERGCAVFVNASGIGARDLVGDAAVYPARGQVHLVKGVARQATAWHLDADGSGARSLRYVIPRPNEGTTILGGSKDVGSWSADVDQRLKRDILDGCRYIAGELCTGPDGGFEVCADQVGLRPGREGGARVDKEPVEGFGGRRWLVHAYGHAGGGFQNSIGVAGDVLRLVDECCEQVRRDGKKQARSVL